MLQSTTIGNKIANARKKLNLSQATLAQQVSISPQAEASGNVGDDARHHNTKSISNHFRGLI